MPTETELLEKFVDEADKNPTVMLGLVGVDQSHTQPMAAHIGSKKADLIYFFTTQDNRLVEHMGETHEALITYASKGHDLFACIHGTVSLETEATVAQRFWNSSVARWYKDGLEDPTLAFLRFDAREAEFWRATFGDKVEFRLASLFSGTAAGAASDKNATVQY